MSDADIKEALVVLHRRMVQSEMAGHGPHCDATNCYLRAAQTFDGKMVTQTDLDAMDDKTFGTFIEVIGLAAQVRDALVRLRGSSEAGDPAPSA